MSNGINIKANTINIYFNKKIEQSEYCEHCESGDCEIHENFEPLEELK